MLAKCDVQASEDLVQGLAAVAELCPPEIVTPLKYLVFIRTYVKIFLAKKKTITIRLDRFKVANFFSKGRIAFRLASTS
jgi:hypothetical protein